MKSSILSLLTSLLVATGGYAYTNLGNGVLQSNGSAADTQAAINAASSGNTVIIPNGSYTWSSAITISKSLTLQGQSKGGVTITNNYSGGNMITLTSGTDGHITLSQINFVSLTGQGGAVYTVAASRTYLGSSNPYTVLIHDCKFTVQVYNYSIYLSSNGIIIWNCTFIGQGELGGIIEAIREDSTWNTPNSMGAYNPSRPADIYRGDDTGLRNTYIEDCAFYDASTACTDFEDDSRAVVRHCTLHSAALGTHGQESGPYGIRHFEIYSNTFIYDSSGTGPSGNTYPLAMNYWIQIRGGTMVCTNNQMDDIPFGKTQIELNVYSIQWPGQIPCQTAYPAARQTGWGWSASSSSTFGTPVVTQDGKGEIIDPVYVWNNTGGATTDPGYVNPIDFSSDGCGNGLHAAQFIQQNRDYYINVARPNWSPYAYPHPLRSGAAVSPSPTSPAATPLPPQNLRVLQ